MRLTLRRVAVAAATLATAAGIGTLTAPSAASAYSASGLCGSSYYNIDQHTLKHNGYTIAVVYLSYNGSSNCVVTIKNRYYGTSTLTEAHVAVGRHGYRDIDDYKYYAGPVYVYAKGECITWGGAATYNRSTGAAVSYNSPPEHCG